jgi:hypothetical protein
MHSSTVLWRPVRTRDSPHYKLYHEGSKMLAHERGQDHQSPYDLSESSSIP